MALPIKGFVHRDLLYSNSIISSLHQIVVDSDTLICFSSHKQVNIDVLRRKTVLLLISDLDMFREEVDVLAQIHNEKEELNYEIVWLPIVDRSTPWNEENQHKFQQLQLRMPWYTVYVVKYSLLEPAIIRYIKEVWKFQKKLVLVGLDP